MSEIARPVHPLRSTASSAVLALTLTSPLLPGCTEKALTGEDADGTEDPGNGDADAPAEPVELGDLELGIYAVDTYRINEGDCGDEGPSAPDAPQFAVAALYDNAGRRQVVILPCADLMDCVALADETETGELTVDPVFMFDTALSDGSMTGEGRDNVTVPSDSGACMAFDEELSLIGFGTETLEGQSLIHRLEWDLVGSTCADDFDAGGIDGECVQRVDWRATLAAVRE